MKKSMFYLLFSVPFLFFCIQTSAQKANTSATPVQVIQFHSEHRCMTCLKIEKLTRSVLAKHFPAVSFRLYNVDDKKNSKIAEQFEATGTALFLYNPRNGKQKNLTEFAFMKAGNEAAFEEGLKKTIAEFLKS